MAVKQCEQRIKGDPISRGIAVGPPLFFAFAEATISKISLDKEMVAAEIGRYCKALASAREDILMLQRKLEQEKVYEGASILDAHLELLRDPAFTSEMEAKIARERTNSEYLLFCILEEYRKLFQSITDPLFRERYQDLQDVYRRLLSHLSQAVKISLSDIQPGSVVFANQLTASDVAEVELGRIAAFVTEEGSSTSHAAIVAKAKGIPFITNIDFTKLKREEIGQVVIVDGRLGEVIFNPTEETFKGYRESINQLQLHLKSLQKGVQLKAETFDGYQVRLSGNLDMLAELDLVWKHGAEGIGLFRTEYICENFSAFPTEEKQYAIYKRLVKKLKGLPVTIRTFDVGGDKFAGINANNGEENPFLGCRAIRFLLRERELFLTQLRAILRAAVEGNVSLMFPMISTLAELLEAKELVAEARRSLKRDGLPCPETLAIGCMIEVPSVALIADHMAEACDFLSIGTNDLVQYALAVDRGNHALKSLYAPTDPSVIRLIQYVISQAAVRGVPVSICGEIAADPRFTPLLLGLGLQQLSVAPRYIPIIKHAIRNTSIIEASQLVEHLLSLSDAKEILDHLTLHYKQSFPDDCLYND